MTEYKQGVWYGWNGGECPVHPETVVEYITAVHGAARRESTYGQVRAHDLFWTPAPDGWVVIAFRVIKEHKEPREFWLCLGEIFDSKDDARIQYGSGPAIIHVREVL